MMRPCRGCAAEHSDELASLYLTELHAANPSPGSPQHNGLARISQELAAVRDFDPAEVRSGSTARITAVQPCRPLNPNERRQIAIIL
jgi:hypothetical protein